MPNLVPFDQFHGASNLSRSQSRQVARSLGGLQASSSVQSARIEAAADLQALRADPVTYVGKRAMQDSG